MKHQVFFPLKNNEKIFMNIICCSCDWRFKGKHFSAVTETADFASSEGPDGAAQNEPLHLDLLDLHCLTSSL